MFNFKDKFKRGGTLRSQPEQHFFCRDAIGYLFSLQKFIITTRPQWCLSKVVKDQQTNTSYQNIWETPAKYANMMVVICR